MRGGSPGLTLTLCHGVGCVEVAPPLHLICGRREEEGEGGKKSHQGGDGCKEGSKRKPRTAERLLPAGSSSTSCLVQTDP